MKNIPDIGIQIPTIMLPKTGVDLEKWAVIACDQFTSEPEYWEKVISFVGKSPSTLNLVLPEVFLTNQNLDNSIKSINKTMDSYLEDGILMPYEGMILVERSVDSQTRHGIMLAIDLEAYDYNPGSHSLIRATEGTILDRLPPRIKIRQDASLEVPHILVLIDDPEYKVIEPIVENKNGLRVLYDFELMQNSGHLKGYAVENDMMVIHFISAFRSLAEKDTFSRKYGVDDKDVLLIAVGDGNHSLATAKAIWEAVKSIKGMNHPARYSLVELVNIHDPGLEFKPIHRILFGVKEDYQGALQDYYGNSIQILPCSKKQELYSHLANNSPDSHNFGIVTSSSMSLASIRNTTSTLAIGSVQPFLDKWYQKGGYEKIDYVHGDDVVLKLGSQPENLGIMLPEINKSDLFKIIIKDGIFPRKAFSMGEAKDKRFYLESRLIM